MMNRGERFNDRGTWAGKYKKHADFAFCFPLKTKHLPGSYVAGSIWHSRRGQAALPRRAGPAARSAHVGDRFHGEYQM